MERPVLLEIKQLSMQSEHQYAEYQYTNQVQKKVAP